ncbi:MAG: SDR family NAD(P)-dependent oxidoreductase [Caldilineaceae bacterium]|nr:SDR family NAD(P)-dependent oxidoreductase [Caldilineaceae bacterium]
MATCLVTGGAGFIGSHLVDRLIEANHAVVVIDNETTGSRRNLHKDAIYINGDVAKVEELRLAFEYPIDVVFHVAGQASIAHSFDAPVDDLTTNVTGTVNVLQLCLEHRVPRLLYASSMTVYGRPNQSPVDEEEPCKPISYYGITKYAAERYVLATGLRDDLDFPFDVTALRMFNVYGARQRLDNPYQGVLGFFLGCVLRGDPIPVFGDGSQPATLSILMTWRMDGCRRGQARTPSARSTIWATGPASRSQNWQWSQRKHLGTMEHPTRTCPAPYVRAINAT